MAVSLSHIVAALVIAFVAFIWGVTFPAVQYTLRAGLTVGAFLSLRFTLGAAGLALFLLVRRISLTRRALWEGLALGVVLTAAYWFQTDGLRFTTSSKSAFITGLFVLFTPLVGLLVGDRIERRHAIAAVIALLGLYALVRNPGQPWGGWNRGDSETLACAALFGAQLVMTAHFSRHSAAAVLAFVQVAVVAVVSLGVSLLFPGSNGLGDLSVALIPGVLATLVVTGILATAFAFWVQCTLLTKVAATEAAVLFSLEPVFATLAAVSGYVGGIHEHLSVTQWAGALVILVATIFAEQGSKVLEREQSPGYAAPGS